MLISSVGISLFISLLFTEFTGLLTGGLISPGYLALFAFQPARLLTTLGVALVTAGLVRLFAKFVVVYGRRRFALCIITGYLLGMASSFFVPSILGLSMDLRAVGYIIPGLIAYDALRQGLLQTLLALGVTAALTRLCLELSALAGLF